MALQGVPGRTADTGAACLPGRGGCGEGGQPRTVERCEAGAAVGVEIRRPTNTNPVNDSLRDIFPPSIVAEFRRSRSSSRLLEYRLRVLEVGGPWAGHPDWRHVSGGLRKQQAAWEAYLDAALAACLLDGEHGKELRSRLVSKQETDFRSGMAECLGAWFFAGKLRQHVNARPTGRGNSVLEFSIHLPDLKISAEVKAPAKEL